MMIVGLIAVILSPIFSALMQALSRKGIFADSTAIEITRNPKV